jgi:hypothetical protein
MDKRIRGTFKVDTNKTPQENITEILKKTMPVRLTLNKLQEGESSSNQESFKMNGVTITAIGNYKWSICKDTNEFQRILFTMQIPSNRWGRDSRKSWSVPVHVKENGEKRISFSAVTNVFNELMRLFSDGEKEENKRIEKEQLAKDNLIQIKEKSGIPKEINISHSRNYSSSDDYKGEIANYARYGISLSLSELNEEQVMKMSSLLQEIIKIKKLIQK